jgi:hypothetical protein
MDEQPLPGPLAALPIEWLVQVMDHLPTQSLFQIMSTNREWECGSRYVLKHRDSLIFDTGSGQETFAKDEVRVSRKKKKKGLAAAAMQSILKNMKRVKKLEIYRRKQDEDVMPLVTAYAGRLEQLTSNFMWSENEMRSFSEMVFPNLKTLSILKVFDASFGVKCFPKLKELHAETIVNASHENAVMPLLEEIVYDGISYGESELQQFVRKNAATLKVLDADTGDDGPLKFDKNLIFPKLMKVCMDDCTFVSQCPSLTSVQIRYPVSSSILKVPAEQLTEFKARMPGQCSEKDFVFLISRMANLKQLRLITHKCLDDRDLMVMFVKMTKLEAVYIGIEGGEFRGGNILEWTDRIREKNKQLKSLVIETRKEDSYDFLDV